MTKPFLCLILCRSSGMSLDSPFTVAGQKGWLASKARLPDNWNPFSNGTNGPLLQDQDSLHASWCKHRRRAPSIKRQNRACLIPLHRTNLEWSWTFSTIWRQFWLLRRLTSCIKTIAKVLVKDARELDELEELLTISAETSVLLGSLSISHQQR